MRLVTLTQKKDHVLREHTSANQIESFLRCQRYWGFNKLLGIEPKEKAPWLDLGSELHWQLRCYARGYQLNVDTEAGKRALAGLHLLPDPKTVDCVEDEAPVKIDSLALLPHVEPLEVQGARDLTLGIKLSDRFVWSLWDYKTTRGNTRTREPWAYVMTPEKLSQNVAGNLYAWDVMWNRQVETVPARWIYFLTDKARHPDAKATDHTFRLKEVVELTQLYLSIGDEHRSLVRQFRSSPFDVNALPANRNACLMFGGCPYRAETGGPCNVTRTLGAMMTQAQGQNPASEIERMLAERRAAPQGAPGGPPPGYPQQQNGPPPGYAPQQQQQPGGPPPMQGAPAPPPPPGPPMQGQGMPGIPTGGQPYNAPAPMAAAPQWAPPQPQNAPSPGYGPPAQYGAPPGYSAQPPTPPAPHLPPEAYVLPPAPGYTPPASQMGYTSPAPGGYSNGVSPPLPLPSPLQGNGVAPLAATEPKRRGRKPGAAAAAKAAAAALANNAQPPSPLPQEFPVDERAQFMRSSCLIAAGSVDLANRSAQEVGQLAMNTVAFAEQCWNWLQASKA
jgi:hypothetical protein